MIMSFKIFYALRSASRTLVCWFMFCVFKARACMWHCSSFLSSSDEASCMYLQVKRVMNGVFHSLRGEFDLSESYSGQAVLEVIVSTIKVNVFAINFQSSRFGMSGYI